MIAYLNDRFVPEEHAVVSVLDRGFLYGDGLFETIRILNGRPFRWDEHVDRLQAGGRCLGIRIPVSSERLGEAAGELIRTNGLEDAFLRLSVSRGIGPRGYSPRGADRPTVAMTLHAAGPLGAGASPKWRLVTSSFRLAAGDPLARYKTANKLPQIMARAEADSAGADEALLLNTAGHVVEGASSNLFWICAGRVKTPSLPEGILPGITRAVVIELCAILGMPFEESDIGVAHLKTQDGVFLSLSTAGVVPAVSLDGRSLRQSDFVARLAAEYQDILQRETACT